MCTIPVYIISFNNGTYVANMVHQILVKRLTTNIVIIDNCTTHRPSLEILQRLESLAGVKIIRNPTNEGHVTVFRQNLPDVCALTDPDLQLHPHLPENALEIMSNIAETYNAQRVGFAIDISEPDLIIDIPNYIAGKNIVDWERQYWNQRCSHPTLEMYHAPIDTTFCLYSKHRNQHMQLRIAGTFTCKHLPWYKTPLLDVPEDELHAYKNKQTCSSTFSPGKW